MTEQIAKQFAYTLVDAERTDRSLSGTLYPSDPRLLIRTPDKILFSAGGVKFARRAVDTGKVGYHSRDQENYTFHRCTKAVLAGLRERIDKEFGTGATDAALDAWKHRKTALVDGGGVPMKPTNRVVVQSKIDNYAEVTTTREVDLTGRIKTCLQCTKNLTPRTNIHWMGDVVQPNHPRSLEACQRMTNEAVVACYDYGMSRPDLEGYIERFHVWDGESVLDPYFCDNKCAALYGRRAAAELPLLEPGVLPAPIPHVIREDTHHYDEAEAEARRRANITRMFPKSPIPEGFKL